MTFEAACIAEQRRPRVRFLRFLLRDAPHSRRSSSTRLNEMVTRRDITDFAKEVPPSRASDQISIQSQARIFSGWIARDNEGSLHSLKVVGLRLVRRTNMAGLRSECEHNCTVAIYTGWNTVSARPRSPQ